MIDCSLHLSRILENEETTSIIDSTIEAITNTAETNLDLTQTDSKINYVK
jgi:hypothetical protein